MKKSIQFLFCVIISSLLFFAGCETDDEGDQYKFTVESYYSGFHGYYYIDGSYVTDFLGSSNVDLDGNNHYYYEKQLPSFSSVKIYVYKDGDDASVSISVWKDGKEVATKNSVSTSASIDPLYYEVSE